MVLHQKAMAPANQQVINTVVGWDVIESKTINIHCHFICVSFQLILVLTRVSLVTRRIALWLRIRFKFLAQSATSTLVRRTSTASLTLVKTSGRATVAPLSRCFAPLDPRTNPTTLANATSLQICRSAEMSLTCVFQPFLTIKCTERAVVQIPVRREKFSDSIPVWLAIWMKEILVN